ncbi:MAG: hypothetical protein V7459_13970 [Oceanicoccus sp.]
MKPFSDDILAQADQLVAASKGLDYQGIVEHRPDEVARLHRVLAELNIERSIAADTVDSDNTTVSDPVPVQREEALFAADLLAAESDVAGKGMIAADRLAIRSSIMKSLSADGLEGRVGLVYNSASKSRTSTFDGVHHHRGIPEFDVVIAPDYAPVPGMHGVFISATEIMSIILPSGDPAANWQVVKRKGYEDRTQMMEYLGLISAGFDLPKE